MAEPQPFLIDVSRLIWRAWSGRHVTGIDRVCLAYLRQYAGRSQAVVMTAQLRRVLPVAASRALFEVLLADRRNFRWRFVGWLARYGFAFGSGERGRGRICFNIGHTGLDRPGLVDWYRDFDLRPIHFIHDIIPITHPQYCRAGEADRHRARMNAALASATGLIANSQATVDTLRAYADDQGMRFPPIVAAWLGVADILGGTEGEGGEAERQPAQFTVLGTIEARKNHRLLIDVWRRLASRGGASVPILNIVGQRGWEIADVLDALDHDEAIKPYVIEHTNLDDAGLRTLLRQSRALLFPSLVEGYGLPMVEAMGLKVPVIASDLPVFREIGEGIPLFIDPHDPDAWLTAVQDFSNAESADRSRQTARLAGYAPPRWDDHFHTVDDWLGRQGFLDLQPGED